MKQLKIKHFWRYCLLVFLVLIVLAGGGALYSYGAIKPHQDANQRAIKTAKEYVDFSQINHVDTYNGREVFYTVFGKDKENHQVMVTINKYHDGQVYVYQAEQGITSQQAKNLVKQKGAKTIQKVTFGMAKGVPVWEVRANGAYYLVNFETGDLVEKEGL